jgi:hypothetical protein
MRKRKDMQQINEEIRNRRAKMERNGSEEMKREMRKTIGKEHKFVLYPLKGIFEKIVMRTRKRNEEAKRQ